MIRGMVFIACNLLILISYLASATSSPEEEHAREFIKSYDEEVIDLASKVINARWNYKIDMREENQLKMYKENDLLDKWIKEVRKNASRFDWKSFEDESLIRCSRWFFVNDIYVLPAEKRFKAMQALGNMTNIYSTTKVCGGPRGVECLPITPDLENIMYKSRDWDELVWAWKGWRDVSGKKMRGFYQDYVALNNEAADINGYDDTGHLWRSYYEHENFEEEITRLFETVRPLYEQLHAYVRRTLKEIYPEKANQFPASGHIPAHLLGDMWAKEWNNIADDLRPFKDKQSVDVTDAMIAQNYTARRMFKLAEDFFVSIGLDPMVDSFWTKSMFEKPRGRNVTCHPTAWDFFNRKDFRISYCSEINMNSLLTIHHEMGHIEYFYQYRNKSTCFRQGANPAFHEAVGDVISLSVVTPEHLHSIGLLDEVEEDLEADLNYLMSQALKIVAFLPFAYLTDLWRWSVFRGDTTPRDYNSKWWSLRCSLQGLYPPVERSEEDFDPGAFYHVAVSTPKIRYFVSYILQFQIHDALCKAAGSGKPLHRCDIYNSTKAGDKLRKMLEYGSSVKWPEVLESLTGTPELKAEPLMAYFKPLHDWLIEQNQCHTVGWKVDCPAGSFVKDESNGNVPSAKYYEGKNGVIGISPAYVQLTVTFVYIISTSILCQP